MERGKSQRSPKPPTAVIISLDAFDAFNYLCCQTHSKDKRDLICVQQVRLRIVVPARVRIRVRVCVLTFFTTMR